MKQTLRYYTPVALVLAIIVALATMVTLFTGTRQVGDDRPRVVTTVYPLYAAVSAVVGDTDGIVVERLSGSADGCMHDYQLSPRDRIILQQADLLLLNGAGAEVFLDDILPGLEATVVDTGVELPLLCGGEHHHGEGEEHHDHAYNEHLWTSPTHYAKQVEVVTAALCALDPENAAAYTENGTAYARRVGELGDRLREAVTKLSTNTCVTFHDSLAYFADDVGLEVTVALQAGTDAGLSAGDLSAVEQAVEADPNILLLYDSQYALRYDGVDGLVAKSRVLVLDTAVTGAGDPAEAWLTAMEENVKKLEGAA